MGQSSAPAPCSRSCVARPAQVLDGDIYAGLDSSSAKLSQLRLLATRRGLFLTDSQLATVEWSALLPPGQAASLRLARELHAAGERCGLSGAMTADLSQSGAWLRTGPWLQTITRSALMCSVSSNHFYTPSEIDFAMGWPTIEHPALAKYGKLGIREQYSQLSMSVRQSLAGNGMMLQQLVSFFVLTTGSLMRRCVLEAIRLPLSASTTCPDEEEDAPNDGA